MRYVFLIKPHSNVRYRQSLQTLALAELRCLLAAWGMEDSSPEVRLIGGEPFLTFECEPMSEETWKALSRHSAVCFAAEQLPDGSLRPLERCTDTALPDDLPHVLKYKGKTNADFTYMMLNCAKAASAFARDEGRLTVLDPMCGKATTLFCALCEGHDAVGVETDGKELQEAAVYFERSLKWHRIKHKRSESSKTLSGGGSAKCISFAAAKDAEAMKAGETLSLSLIQGDAVRLTEMVKPGSVHLIVSDLPYGVQHAPQGGGRVSSLTKLLGGIAPGCAKALRPGGALAFSFNLNTLRRQDAAHILGNAGLTVLQDPPYADFSHWVEQAVERDLIVAVKPARPMDIQGGIRI